jgi:hypothetical protein
MLGSKYVGSVHRYCKTEHLKIIRVHFACSSEEQSIVTQNTVYCIWHCEVRKVIMYSLDSPTASNFRIEGTEIMKLFTYYGNFVIHTKMNSRPIFCLFPISCNEPHTTHLKIWNLVCVLANMHGSFSCWSKVQVLAVHFWMQFESSFHILFNYKNKL